MGWRFGVDLHGELSILLSVCRKHAFSFNLFWHICGKMIVFLSSQASKVVMFFQYELANHRIRKSLVSRICFWVALWALKKTSRFMIQTNKPSLSSMPCMMVWRMLYVFLVSKTPSRAWISALEPERSKRWCVFSLEKPITELFRGWGWGDCNHFRLLQGIYITMLPFSEGDFFYHSGFSLSSWFFSGWSVDRWFSKAILIREYWKNPWP